MSTQQVHVWDRFIRFFHWSLAIVFTLLYLTATYEYDETHFLLAYLLLLLLVSRVVWGFSATGHAQFASFIYPLSETVHHFREMFSAGAKRHVGHNPAGALMIFAFLILLITMVVTGFVMLTWGEYDGPLWALGIEFADSTAKLCRSIHETSSDLLLILVALHLTGVALSSLLHGENLAAAMWHGKKRGSE